MTLHALAEQGDASALIEALDSAISPDARDDQGRTPLMVAAASPQAGANVLEILLAHGADPNAVTAPPQQPPVDVTYLTRAAEELGLDSSHFATARATIDIQSVLCFAAQAGSSEKIRV